MWQKAPTTRLLLGAALLVAGCRSGATSRPQAPTASASLPASPIPSTASPAAGVVLASHAEPAPPESLPPPKQVAPGGRAPEAEAQGFTLAEAFAMALAANPDLQAAQERSRYAEAVLARARADFYPTLSWIENYQASNNPLNRFSYLLEQGQLRPLPLLFPPSVVDNLQNGLHFQEDLYSGGLRSARAGAAAGESEASRFALAAVRNQVLYQVAEAYYRLFQATELVKVRRQSVKQVESELESVQARLRAQSAVREDVLRVEARLAAVREGLVTALNQQELSWAVLENVVGARLTRRVLPESLPPWSDRAGFIESAVARAVQAADGPDEADAAVNEALEKRPEVGQVQAQRRAAEERIRAAQAAYKPQVGFFSDYNFFTGSTGAGRQSFITGLAASLNLCDSGRTRANVEQARAQLGELIARDRRIQLDVELDVRRAYLQLKDARERLRVATFGVARAEEALRLVESRYANQSATVTELIDTQVGQTDARVRETNARAEIEVARAALQRAIGRFTDLVNPPHPPGH